MNKRLLNATLIAGLILPLAVGQEMRPAPPSPSDYRIKTGDSIQVVVAEHPEFSKTVVVDGKGRIKLPPVTLRASGLSALELATTIRQELQKKVANPQVTICVGCTLTPARPGGGEMRDVVPSQVQVKTQE